MGEKKAFTLIELLVVISVIALLLSILVPSLSVVKDQAKSTICSSNLRQLALGLIQYANENSSKVMPVTDTSGEYWFHEIAPYLGDEEYKLDAAENLQGPMQVMYCSITKPLPPDQVDGIGTDKLAWRYLGADGAYGMNLWLSSANGALYAGSDGLDLAKYFPNLFAAKSEVPAFGDSIWVGSWPLADDEPPLDLVGGGYNGGGSFPHDQGYFMGRFCVNRHNMAINVSHVGGHISKVKLEDLWTLYWHLGWRTTQPDIDLSSIR